MSYLANVSKIAQSPDQLPQVGTPQGGQKATTCPHLFATTFQIYLKFCPFGSPKFPRKHQAPPKIYSLCPFCPVWQKICHDGAGKLEDGSGLYGGTPKEGHPPPIAERQHPSTPIIFRTKNTEKSRLGLIGKNFGKNLRENVSGERKAPSLAERGRGAKI